MSDRTATIRIAMEAQTASLQRGFNDMKSAIGGVESKMSGAVSGGLANFAAAGLAVYSAFKTAKAALDEFIRVSDNMDKQEEIAYKVGLTADQVGALQLAAKLCDADVEELNASLIKMTKTVSDAATGSGPAAGALAELGLHAGRLNDLPTDKKLGAIADAMLGVTNQNDRLRLSMEIFGKQGSGFVELLSKGSAGLNDFAGEAERLGMAFGTQRQQVDEANKAIDKIKFAWDAMVGQLVVAVAPAINAVATGIGNVLAWFNRLTGRVSQSMKTFGGGMADAKLRPGEDPAELKQAKEAQKAADKAAEDAKRRAESITQSLRQPSEVFADTVAELNDLVKQGAISWETYQRGVRRATDEVRKGADAIGSVTTPAVGAVTRAGGAFSAVQEATRRQRDTERRHREIADYLKKIYDRQATTASPILQPLSIT